MVNVAIDPLEPTPLHAIKLREHVRLRIEPCLRNLDDINGHNLVVTVWYTAIRGFAAYEAMAHAVAPTEAEPEIVIVVAHLGEERAVTLLINEASMPAPRPEYQAPQPARAPDQAR